MAIVYRCLPVVLLLCSLLPLLSCLIVHTILPPTSNSCPAQKCITLEQFAKMSNDRNGIEMDADIQLILLPGNHSLSSGLNVTGRSYLGLHSTGDKFKTHINCNNSSWFLFSNISKVVVENVSFSECESMTAVNLYSLIVRNSKFVSEKSSDSLLSLRGTDVRFVMSEFDIMISMDGEFVPATNVAVMIANSSNVTVESSIMTVKQGSLLIAESESTVVLINSSIVNSTCVPKVTCSSALIQISSGKLNISNSRVIQNIGEMLISARHCAVNISNSSLGNNNATYCILCSVKSNVSLTDVIMSRNYANFSIVYLLETKLRTCGNMTFSNNTGSFVVINSSVKFLGLNVIFANSSQTNSANVERHPQAQGTLTAIRSTVKFYSNTSFLHNNSTQSGSAMYASQCIIMVYQAFLVAGNRAEKSGGGLFLLMTSFICLRNCSFVRNVAAYSGGGIHADSTLIRLQSRFENSLSLTSTGLKFINNEADFGGGLYLELNSKFNCIVDKDNYYNITFKFNKAYTSGGAIFVRDETYPTMCNSTSSFVQSTQTECFFQVLYKDIVDEERQTERKYSITFIDNTATVGSSLYGGLLDRCSLNPMAEIYNTSVHEITTTCKSINRLEYLLFESGWTVDVNDIASDAVQVCYCQDNALIDCRNSNISQIQKGQKFNIPVVAVDQMGNPVNATIRAALLEENLIGEGQQLQKVNGQCTNVTFSISSPHDSVNLILYADEGPCENKGISSHNVSVNFKNCSCSVGFRMTSDTNRCDCTLDPQLKGYVTVEFNNSFKRIKNSWINYSCNGTDCSYFIHPICPYDYCKSPENSTFNLNPPNGCDEQCNFNRVGLLCGHCKEGYTLSISSSRCLKCPQNWPGLLVGNLLFGTISGIVLVLVLLFLNLTVAWGTMNGIIFYANIVLTNRSIFLSFTKTSFFTVVVYIFNTQLGVERCVWEGMNAYGMIWFSYVYPLYLLVLVFTITVISNYSKRFAIIIGNRNPIATLATLILFSYTYFIRSALYILSYAKVKYPDGAHEIVWLPDASVKYFQGKHIPLFITAVLILLLGIVYAFLLFSWQWLQCMPNIKMFWWIRSSKLNFFIEAYHAPYRPKYRYWTGLLLLTRVVLNIAITVNTSGDPHYNLLVTGVVLSGLIILKAFLGSSLYKNTLLDYSELLCYFNLLMLTLFTLYFLENRDKRDAVMYTSVSVIFTMFVCILVYHLHYTFVNNISKYRKFCEFVLDRVKRNRSSERDDSASLTNSRIINECTRSEIALSDINQNEASVCEHTSRDRQNNFESKEMSLWTTDSLREPLL